MLESDRLYITPYKSDDLADLFNLISNKELTYPAGFKPVPDFKICQNSLQYRIMSKQYVKLILKDTKTYIGEINFYKDESRRNPNAYEIGFILLKEYWGKGLMQEALKTFIPYFNKKINIDILSMTIFVGNTKSENTVSKLGFHKDGVRRRYKKMYDDNVLDISEYSLTKDELERTIELWQKY